MSVNTPDKWVVIKITNQSNETHYRVFACWYGGYIGSDSWQMNSGITKVNLVNNFYEFIGSSGSVYRCHINSYGTSGYGQSVLNNFINKSEELTIEVMPEDTDYITLEYSE
jgi:hypothetical protein